MTKKIDKTIEADDGWSLASTHFAPENGEEAAILINSALATPRSFYFDFADWLASKKNYVVTFDYRGIGDSRGPNPGDVQIDDWVHFDIATMLEWLQANRSAEKLYVFGHSMGGQIMGLLGDRYPLDAMATFSAQSGYWRIQAPGERLRLLLASYIIFPGLVYSFGYLPWSKMFGGEDIPKRIALQWSRWCRNPDYFLGDSSVKGRQNFAQFDAPVVAYSFDDDSWGWKQSVDWMMNRYRQSDVERVHMKPEDVGVDSIGHFGFFRKKMIDAWEGLLQKIRTV